MALTSPLTLQPYDYIGDSNGRPLDYGQIYIGIADKDPEFNQIPVYLDKAMTKLADQPLRTKGGFIEFAGDLTAAYASASVYSLKVLDKQGRTVFYKASMMRNNLTDDALTSLDAAISDAQAQVAITSAQVVQDAINNVFVGENLTDKTVVTTPTVSGMVSKSQHDINLNIVNANRFSVAGTLTDAAIKKSIDYAIANNTQVFFDYDVTIKVPTHVSNINDAVHRVSTLHDNKITVLIELGHQPTQGAILSGGDYSRVSIKASSAVLMLSPSFTGRFIAMSGGIAPRLECYIDANGSALDRIYSVVNGTGFVAEGCGGSGANGRPLYANNSSIYAGGSIWRDFGDSLYASAGSSIQLGSAIITGGLVTANGSLVASRGSSIEAQKLTMSNCKTGFESKRAGSAINAHEATISNIGTGFLARASRGAIISLSESIITEVLGNGLEALDAGVISFGEGATMTASANNNQTGVRAIGGTVALGNSTVEGFGVYNLEARAGGLISGDSCKVLDSKGTGVIAYRGGKALIYAATVTGSGNQDLRVLDGGEINIKAGTTTNSPVGSPVVTDSNLDGFGGFNTIAESGRGIIWA